MASSAPIDTAAVLSRLELPPVKTDLAGLRTFYHAWCLKVPFDNLRKTNALFRKPDGQLPDLRANSFVEEWLANGTGGTCWPHGEALYSTLKALGFDAYRATGSMFDVGAPTHATALVRLDDGSTWLLDNALLTMEPLRIDPGAPSLFQDPVHSAEVEIEGDQVFIHGTHPPMTRIFFRLLERDVSYSRYEELWAASRNIGPFNGGAHIRRNENDRIRTLRGRMLFTLDAGGMKAEPLDAEGIKTLLRGTMGIREAFVDDWAASGALEASLNPPGPMPDLPVRVPPSKR